VKTRTTDRTLCGPARRDVAVSVGEGCSRLMNQAGRWALFLRTQRTPTMRLGLIAAVSALTLCCLPTASAQCDDKSQQNAADEWAVRGDLAAGSKCAGPSDTAKSEQKLEDAAVRAKRKTDDKNRTDERSGTLAHGDRRENSSPPGKR
jgi:hypothetical protein